MKASSFLCRFGMHRWKPILWLDLWDRFTGNYRSPLIDICTRCGKRRSV